MIRCLQITTDPDAIDWYSMTSNYYDVYTVSFIALASWLLA
jgi:hypothetical protein